MAEYKDGVLIIRLAENFAIHRRIYLMSDVHFDSVYCERSLLKKHLDKAKEENAIIIIGGDFFDAMQGRFDPRRSLDELRPEYRRDDYYDFVVRDASEFLKPFASHIVMITQGNHESAVLKNANINLTDRLAYSLGQDIVSGMWKGWIRVVLTRSHQRGSVNLYYAHSAGDGNASVTRGVIATNRQAVYIPDADVIWNAHNHHAYIVPITRERLSNKGVRYTDIGWYVRSPGYKRDWLHDSGFAAEKGHGPRPLGCVVITIEIKSNKPSLVTAELLLEA